MIGHEEERHGQSESGFDDKSREPAKSTKDSSTPAQHPERSLADVYNPLAMDPALVKAHDKLDRVVDKAFGADRKLTTERQRLENLFSRYAEMTSTDE
ncbi:type IIL restriction-modification enzyme MmeI [Candidatus Corynebacterium faecigallinarum]|uniref:type IIL restriction-modification enzyme MmeI n=1 Tax=Candidatus Corynebacterium faecigallinarum TaxID=2838528 RepID=UPI003FD0B5D2